MRKWQKLPGILVSIFKLGSPLEVEQIGKSRFRVKLVGEEDAERLLMITSFKHGKENIELTTIK